VHNHVLIYGTHEDKGTRRWGDKETGRPGDKVKKDRKKRQGDKETWRPEEERSGDLVTRRRKTRGQGDGGTRRLGEI
jgi:hypothetical protein